MGHHRTAAEKIGEIGYNIIGGTVCGCPVQKQKGPCGVRTRLRRLRERLEDYEAEKSKCM